jgi:hypothetical protein
MSSWRSTKSRKRRPLSRACNMYNDPFIDVNWRRLSMVAMLLTRPRPRWMRVFEKNLWKLNKDSLKEIWNNEHYQAARALFKDSGSANNRRSKTICLRCRIYLERSSRIGQSDTTGPSIGSLQQAPISVSSTGTWRETLNRFRSRLYRASCPTMTILPEVLAGVVYDRARFVN